MACSSGQTKSNQRRLAERRRRMARTRRATQVNLVWTMVLESLDPDNVELAVLVPVAEQAAGGVAGNRVARVHQH
jgi:hypothetical protein